MSNTSLYCLCYSDWPRHERPCPIHDGIKSSPEEGGKENEPSTEVDRLIAAFQDACEDVVGWDFSYAEDISVYISRREAARAALSAHVLHPIHRPTQESPASTPEQPAPPKICQCGHSKDSHEGDFGVCLRMVSENTECPCSDFRPVAPSPETTGSQKK